MDFANEERGLRSVVNSAICEKKLHRGQAHAEEQW